MQLTEHFADTELGVAGCEQRIVGNAMAICGVLLEPVRAQFGAIAVDDGYRDPGHNARVGGVNDSQHLYEAGNSAADIRPLDPSHSLMVMFDWIRLESELPFDQVILEYSSAGLPACIHLSYDSGKSVQRREALIGETNGLSGYTRATVN